MAYSTCQLCCGEKLASIRAYQSDPCLSRKTGRRELSGHGWNPTSSGCCLPTSRITLTCNIHDGGLFYPEAGEQVKVREVNDI
jgi:hypothetical protein